MKKIFFLLFVCVMCNALTGQGTGTLYYVPQNGTGNIVRYEPVSRNHIVYSLKNAPLGIENHFLLTDMVNAIDAHMYDNLTITDFEIIDNYVVFGGQYYYGSGTTGIVGWFDIDSLFNYGVSSHVDMSMYTLGMETVDNIEVFRDVSGYVHIVGYGKTSTPPGAAGNYYRAFEAIGTLSGLFNWRTSAMWRYGIYSDIVDMTVTNNFVVFLGWERLLNSNGIGVTLHPFPKYNMLSSTTATAYYFQLSTYNFYPFYPDYYDPISSPRITHCRGDNVSVCSYRNDIEPDGSTLNGTKYLSHRIFDVSPCLGGLPVQMLSAATALMPGDVSSIVDLNYDAYSDNYVVLHSHDAFVGITEYAVSTIDFSSGSVPAYIVSDYQAAYNTVNYWQPNSMCLDGLSDYTVSGWKQSNFDHILWHNMINTVNCSCNKKIQYPMQSQDIMEQHMQSSPADLQGWGKLTFGMRWSVVLYNFPCMELCLPNSKQ